MDEEGDGGSSPAPAQLQGSQKQDEDEATLCFFFVRPLILCNGIMNTLNIVGLLSTFISVLCDNKAKQI